MNSVANLNREELLKRAKELEDLIDASKQKPLEKPKPAQPSTSLARSSNFASNQFVLSRAEQPPYFRASGQKKLTTSNRGHNRVFVRNKNHEKQQEKTNGGNVKANEAKSVSRTESAASPPTHAMSLSSIDSPDLSTVRADANDISLEKSASSVRHPQNEARDDWLKRHENLVLTIGGDDSSDDDELIRNHHKALRDILHPVKLLISRVHQRKSVVYQSATKLVKVNSASMPKSTAREMLEMYTHSRHSNSTPSKLDVLKKNASLKAAPSPAGSRIEMSSNQLNGSAGSTLDVKLSSASMKLGNAKESSTITAPQTFASGGRKMELKRPTRPDQGIATTSGSSFKHVLKRTRFKLLKGVTVSKKISGPHNKVSRKRSTLKTNKKHLQTLLMLRGVPFQSSKDGKALKRINTSLTLKLAPTTTKMTMKNRLHAVGSSITRVASQLVNRSVYKLNKRKKTGKLSYVSSSSVSNPEQKKDCIFFIRFGKCHKENSCKFQHDPKKVSICTKFLRGTCKAEKCPFSHKVDKDKMPLCSYFQQGQCNATNCPYRHSYFRKDIPHCESFLRGFCEKGQLCPKQHVLVCSNAECSRDPKICPLFHKKKTKTTEAGKTAAAKKEKRSKKLVVRQKSSLERDEAWPEFVTLSGSDDEVADVQMEMPTRTSDNIKRFLERRTRPVWPDYSKGLSADPIDLRDLIRVNGQLRQTIRKARWLRKVRPIKIAGDFVPLHVVPETEAPTEHLAEEGTEKRRSWRRKRRLKKSSIRCSVQSGESSDEGSLSLARARKERLFETDDDADFDPAYRTYGEALQRTKRIRGGLGSAESVSSYTSPIDSSDDSSFIGDDDDRRTSLKFVPRNHDDATLNASKRIHSTNDDDEWLLDYLYNCDQIGSPLPEPERLDFFGPVYEHWEFRTGDRIRETIEKFRSTFEPGARSAAMTTKYATKETNGRGSETVDFIPLRDHEEGEILTESEEDGIMASGDDLAVVDMELASDDEESLLMSPKAEKEQQSSVHSEDDGPRNDVEQSLQFVDDISDLEEGEVL